MGRGVVEMTELTVTHFVETALVEFCLDTRHQIHPEGNFRAVEGCLLDDALRTEGEVGSDDIVSLIGSIAEEVALEDSLCTRKLQSQGVIGVQHSLKLLGIRQSRVGDMYNRLIFSNLSAVVKTNHLSFRVLEFYS